MDNNQQLVQRVTQRAQAWLDKAYDADTRAEVQRMLDNPDKTALIDAFYKDLEFGTGGLRGVMGAGTNRMNVYTVGAATQGLANYLKVAFSDLPQISVVVGHDVRNNSRKFAEMVAGIFSANGIKAYLFDTFRPTPELSFAIRKLGCQSGVNITASHNPPEYNGYKAYWADGAQIIAPHDINIIRNVEAITSVKDIKFEANPALIEIIGDKIDDAFLTAIKELSLSPDVIKRHADLKIVYTPIHGTGVKMVPDSLRRYGFTNIINVPEQDIPSGDFPTVESPNPEVPSALAMAIAKAKATNADLVCASDPDADRIGVAVRLNNGEYSLINGNQIVMILLYYIMKRRVELGQLTGREFIVKTIVTTETIRRIAEAEGIKMFDCYTGFKWIAAVIRDLEGVMQYIGGGEESYGFLAEDFCRDKDSVSAISLMAEAVAWAKDRGLDLLGLLQEIYLRYGFSMEKGISVIRKGQTGAEEIQQMMRDFRATPPVTLGGSKVIVVKDYDDLNERHVIEGRTVKMDFPATSNVLQWLTDDGTKVSVRPSGTEPKIKFYIEVQAPFANTADWDRVNAEATAKIQAVMRDLHIS